MDYNQLLEMLKRDMPPQTELTKYVLADPNSVIGWAVLGFIAALVVVATWWILNALFQVYNVWASQKQGEAELAQSRRDQQIQVAKAQGRLDAAELNKKAAVVEAEAVGAQIEKIGKELSSHDLYLKWQWIKMMEERPEGSTIYVPTEAGLPILEAGRAVKRPVPQSDDEDQL